MIEHYNLLLMTEPTKLSTFFLSFSFFSSKKEKEEEEENEKDRLFSIHVRGDVDKRFITHIHTAAMFTSARKQV